MRLRVLITCESRARTSSAWPLSGLPAVSSASAVKATLPRALAQEAARMPGTTAAGHSFSVVATVCTSPFGSLYVTSASSSLARSIFGRFLSATVAAPALSVVSASLSATSLPSLRGASSSSGSAAVAPRGGWKLNSSKPAMPAARARNSALALIGALPIAPPDMKLSCTARSSAAGAIGISFGPDTRASTSGTRNSSTRKSPLSQRRCRRSSSFERCSSTR